MLASEPLVLAAGLLCDDTIWSPVAAMLAEKDAPVLMRSFAGFTSIEAMAEALLAEAPPRFALAGHSMGARVAIEAYRRAPQRITRLALLNTGVHPVQSHEASSRGRLVALAKSSGMAALAAEWLPPMLGKGADDPQLLDLLTRMIERQTPESFSAQITALLERPEAEKALASVRVPTLLVSATRDRWSPVAQHEAMHRLLPSAELVVIEGAGHMAPIEAPEAVAAALSEWRKDR
jgi:pimeloyl-ACP methyl ester carboxylesterase